MYGYSLGYSLVYNVASLGSNVNPLPPENAIRFEGTNELIHFENDETEQYITFETI